VRAVSGRALLIAAASSSKNAGLMLEQIRFNSDRTLREVHVVIWTHVHAPEFRVAVNQCVALRRAKGAPSCADSYTRASWAAVPPTSAESYTSALSNTLPSDTIAAEPSTSAWSHTVA
jgi:hypothetical protein